MSFFFNCQEDDNSLFHQDVMSGIIPNAFICRIWRLISSISLSARHAWRVRANRYSLYSQFLNGPLAEDPHLNLRTTYKTRCLYGLRHPDPSSTKACHKAARGAFSKYCSDECGVKYMQSRVESWSKKGGKTEKLWESVKNAEKREGVVVCTIQPGDDNDTGACAKMEIDDSKDVKPLPLPQPKRVVQPPLKSKLARETERLDGLLDSVIKLREEIKKGMEGVIWRERLLQLASERAELVGQCGWDHRLCLDDEEWADVGAGVLESYEHVKVESAKEDGVDVEMEVDGSEEQWWCPGQKVCDRHQGYVISIYTYIHF